MGMLRLLLAIAVILDHSRNDGIYMIDGCEAVQIFFVISGFYMALILSDKYGCSSTGLKKFFINRFLRLYPTYYAALIGTIAWKLLCLYRLHLHDKAAAHSLLHQAWTLYRPKWLCLPNYTLVGTDLTYLFDYSPKEGLSLHLEWTGYLSGTSPWLAERLWVAQIWSVGAEICFYALAPLVVFGGSWRVLMFGLASLALQLYIRHIADGTFAYFFWPAEFYYFAMGIIAFKGYAVLKSRAPSLIEGNHLIPLLVAALFWLTLTPMIGLSPSPLFLQGSTLLLVPFLFHMTKNNPVDRFIGNLSYPVYCFHGLFYDIVVTALIRLHWSKHLWPWLTIIVSVIGSSVVYLLVDRSFEGFRRRIAPKRASGSTGASLQPASLSSTPS